MFSLIDLQQIQQFCLAKRKSTTLLDIEDLIKKIPDKLCAAATSLENSSGLWDVTSVCLAHLTVIQTVCESIANNKLIPMLQSSALWNSLLYFASCESTIIRTTANYTITNLVLKLKKLNSDEFVERKIVYLFVDYLINEKYFFKVDTITTLLKEIFNGENELPIDKSVFPISTLLFELAKFHDEVMNNELSFASYIDFLMVVNKIDSTMKYLVLETNHSVLGSFGTHCSRTVTRRQYLRLLKALLPFPEVHRACHPTTTSNFCKKLSSAICEALLKENVTVPYGDTFGSKSIGSNAWSEPDSMLLINVLLQCVFSSDAGCCVINKVETLIRHLFSKQREALCEQLLDIYFAQDDAMFEMLILHLTICQQSTRPQLDTCYLFSPHEVFIELLVRLAYDSSVILDWLTSDETQFMFYLLRYIKYLHTTTEKLFELCEKKHKETNPVAAILSLFIELKISVSKLFSAGLFPFNPKPLLRNLDNTIALLNK